MTEKVAFIRSITCNDRIDKVQGRVDELRTTVPSLEEDLCKIQFYLAQKPDRKEVATKEEITKIVSVHRGRVGKALEKVVSTKEHKFLQENVTGLQKDIETLKESVADKADTKVNADLTMVAISPVCSKKAVIFINNLASMLPHEC